jgi:hypothetical protein
MNKIQQKPRIMCEGMKGQNYWFNGCMEYLMECLGESKDYDYWYFSGITGDSFTQIYCKNIFDMIFCYSDGFLPKIIKKVFDSCGYDFDYFSNIKENDRKTYDNMIKAYIDKGIPVIAKLGKERRWTEYCIIYGYDNDKFYAICGENIEKIVLSDQYFELIFAKEKKNKLLLADVYKNAVMDIPKVINLPETSEFAFGKKAFMYWADSFQNTTFDNFPIEDDYIWYTHPERGFSCWNMHGNYLCILGTNGCSINFLEKTLFYNSGMDFIKDLIPLYEKTNKDGFSKLVEMAGGFELKPKDIKNKKLMEPITEEIKKLVDYCEEINNIIKDRI